MDKRARKTLAGIEAYRPGTSIQEARRAVRARSIIKLASNENPLGMSPRAAKALQGLSNLHRYPDASCGALRQKLAKLWGLEPANIVVGNGSDEILVLAMKAFLEPGDEVLVSYPSFLIYEIQAQAHGARCRRVPLKNYRYDMAGMRKALRSRTKLVFIASPDNPSSTYVTSSELAVFLEAVPEQTLVVLDEAYYEFAAAQPDFPRSLDFLESGKVLITRSFSKIYGLAGLRIGYGMARPEIIAALDAAREPFNVNTPAQVAALAALDDRGFLRETIKLTDEGRSYLTREMSALGLKPVAGCTNFVLAECPGAASPIVRGLFERGVIVRDMGGWKLENCFRVSIGTMAENRRFIRELKAVLKK